MFDLKKQLDEQKISFCPAPYGVIDIRPKMHRESGQRIRTTCCCNLDDEVFTQSQQTDFKQIKELQLQGQWPAECFRCKQEEDQGLVSERILQISKILKSSDTDLSNELLLKRTIEDTDRNFEIRIKFSNLCNLSCRMCSPTESSLHAKITGSDVINEFYLDDIGEDPKIWQHIIDTIKQQAGQHDHTYVHLLGGETLLQPSVKKIVRELIDLNLQRDLSIRMTSALSAQFDQELFDDMIQFKHLDLLLSIDGVGQNYHYLRWPMTFDKVSANLQELISHYRRHQKSMQFMINIILSLNNIFYINEILDYWASIAKNDTKVTLTTYPLVDRTDFMSIKGLPDQYRGKLITILEQACQHEFFSFTDNTMFREFVQGLIGSLQLENFEPDLWQQYLKDSAFFDLKTKTDMKIHNKKFYDHWSESDRTQFENSKSNTNTQVLTRYIGLIKKYDDQLHLQSQV